MVWAVSAVHRRTPSRLKNFSAGPNLEIRLSTLSTWLNSAAKAAASLQASPLYPCISEPASPTITQKSARRAALSPTEGDPSVPGSPATTVAIRYPPTTVAVAAATFARVSTQNIPSATRKYRRKNGELSPPVPATSALMSTESSTVCASLSRARISGRRAIRSTPKTAMRPNARKATHAPGVDHARLTSKASTPARATRNNPALGEPVFVARSWSGVLVNRTFLYSVTTEVLSGKVPSAGLLGSETGLRYGRPRALPVLRGREDEPVVVSHAVSL